MKRLPDWQKRLTGYLQDRLSTPFERGSHDCAMFADGAVEAITGVKLSADYGSYTSLTGAKRHLKRHGFADVADLLADALTEVEPGELSAGDLVTIDSDEGPAVGVMSGRSVYVVTAKRLETISVHNIVRGFRVG